VSVEELIAQVLDVEPAEVRPDLEFGAIPQWDSLNHVNLMVALEDRLGTTIDAEQMVELTTVIAIRDYAAAHGGGPP
jgi:citrate synthase